MVPVFRHGDEVVVEGHIQRQLEPMWIRVDPAPATIIYFPVSFGSSDGDQFRYGVEYLLVLGNGIFIVYGCIYNSFIVFENRQTHLPVIIQYPPVYVPAGTGLTAFFIKPPYISFDQAFLKDMIV